MKLTDIIPKGSEIHEGKSCFFIAEKDFSYKDLSILKNSLVYYDGKSVKVNMMAFGIFQDSNIPEFINGKLPEDEHLNYLVEKCSNCDFEVEKSNMRLRGIWHDNHFDKWSGSFSDYIERIISLPSLENCGITFSSFMYEFNTLTNSLTYFISAKPIKLEVNNKVLALPELLEISKGNTHYTIIPLKGKMEYFNIPLQSILTLSENGTLSGECGEEFDAKIYGHNKYKNITISKGFRVEISCEGTVEIGLFNDKSHKIEKYQIRKSI